MGPSAPGSLQEGTPVYCVLLACGHVQLEKRRVSIIPWGNLKLEVGRGLLEGASSPGI